MATRDGTDMTNEADLLVSGSHLLPMDATGKVVEEGAVAISGDTIVAVGKAAELATRYPQAKRLHTPRGLIMPGLVNTHTHAPMACFRGLADDLPLMTWLTEYIFPAEATLTKEIVHHATLLSLAEMIKSGTTSFCDMYLFAREVAAATRKSGMRAWIGEVLYDFPSPNYGELENGFACVEEMFAAYKGDPCITITVDPHAVYTCSPGLLQRLKKVAAQHEALYVIHLSETKEEVAGCVKQHGVRPVAHLDGLGLLDDRVVADHCVELTGEEIELLARRGVKVAHCPESNLKLASGIAPVPDLLAAGVTVGLGTDGAASNNDVDMFGEMDTAAKIHKVQRLDSTVMSAETVLAMATRGGARLLGAERMIGSLETGKKADLIVLDLDQPHLTPLYHIPSHLVYAARGGDVVHSIINGQVVMENRRLLTLDEPAILAKANEIGERIRGIANRR
ncbi:MAG: amidohydrolase [Thermodesulfobacteriota bacterium]